MQLAIRDVNERRNTAAQIDQRMKFDRPLVLAKARPWKQRQTQIDRGRIQGVDRVLQFDAKPIPGVELAGGVDKAQGEILINTPVAGFVGIGQGAAGDAATNAEG